MATNFKQGEDKKITLVVTETIAVDFSDATDIIIILKSSTDQVVKKYSLNTKTDYGTLEVQTSPNTNKIDIFVEREHSVLFPLGTIRATILADFPNVDFPDGIQTRQFGPIVIGNVQKGEGLDEDL